jgi:uncharacterized protein (TIGR00255 family)
VTDRLALKKTMGSIASMTGYGRAEVPGARLAVSVEIRSLNHRFLEIGVKLPRSLAASELEVRRVVQGRLARGRVDVSVMTRWLAGSRSAVRTDTALAEGYAREARDLAARLGIDSPLGLGDLLRLPGVVSVEEAEEDEGLAVLGLKEALHQALDELCRMRQTEGAALAAEIRAHLAALEAWTAGLGDLLPAALARIRERVHARIQGLLAGAAVEPGRLVQEAALWAARSDIQEELARLGAHGAQFRALLDGGGAVGRQLDFVVQEMHREVNTIASKADDQALVERVLQARTTVERLREQVQNVE